MSAGTKASFGSGMAAGAACFALLCGGLIGLGSFTFIYAKGASYLTDDPAACANCHVMEGHLASWSRSSHHAVATCNDCHTPHDFAGKYLTKALNGYHHSLAFTTGNFPDQIRITPRNAKIAENSCRKCHGEIVAQIDRAPAGAEDRLSCIYCHHDVGHL